MMRVCVCLCLQMEASSQSRDGDDVCLCLQMEASSQSRDGDGGLWNNPRAPQYSKETQDMLTLRMQEARLTNLQRKQINGRLKTSPTNPQRRTAEACRSGNSYVREQYHPGPWRDLEKEKRRLQNIMSTGEEEPTAASHPNVPSCPDPEGAEPLDRYQEVLDEIEERRQFLADMSSLGEEKQYTNIINSEISQLIRELKLLDEARRPKNDAITSERKKMEASSQSRDGDGGLWNNPRAPQYSKGTQDMLTYGAASPLTSDPTSSASPTNPKTTKSVQDRLPQRRTAEACRSGNSYAREQFHAGPSRDLEKEKRRLQSIMSTAEESET
ncbi:UPF0193 protein EVG1 isoform X2 [Anarhichas minor]|uniref:UPF0193 protein EVG1 isoform X2 n=1 Tax=Anarhichas minor TaxID=65739 RepID=UPI003F73435A